MFDFCFYQLLIIIDNQLVSISYNVGKYLNIQFFMKIIDQKSHQVRVNMDNDWQGLIRKFRDINHKTSWKGDIFLYSLKWRYYWSDKTELWRHMFGTVFDKSSKKSNKITSIFTLNNILQSILPPLHTTTLLDY